MWYHNNLTKQDMLFEQLAQTKLFVAWHGMNNEDVSSAANSTAEGMQDSPIYDENGKFIATDSEGFTGEVIVMSRSIYNILNFNNAVMDHKTAMGLGITLGTTIDNLAKVKRGVNGANVDTQVGMINNIINDIVSRTPEMKGFEPNRVFNGSVSSNYDNGVINDEDRICGKANEGTTQWGDFAHTDIELKRVTYNLFKWGSTEIPGANKFSPTVGNLQSIYVHEAGGHVFHKWRDKTKDHYRAYQFQMTHPTWKSTTPFFQVYETNLLHNDYLPQKSKTNKKRK